MNGGTSQLPEGARDFDFLHGSWNVQHRRLRHRLADSDEWDVFGGTMHADPILGGLGNFDRNSIDLPGGRYHACTLRIFNPGTGLWSLHWIDGRDPKLDPPLAGSFAGGVGTFFGDDSFEDRPIRIRFSWERPTRECARWQQAFSADAGATWETNWIMDFTRPPAGAAGEGK